MKTNRIFPAALAATLIVAGGATQALAESDLGDHTLPPYFTHTQMQQSASQDRTMSSSVSAKGDLTLSQAEQKAEQKIGGGKIIATDTFGKGRDNYWVDIKKGDTTDRVYVNGKTSKLAVIDADLFGVDRNSDDDGHRG